MGWERLAWSSSSGRAFARDYKETLAFIRMHKDTLQQKKFGRGVYAFTYGSVKHPEYIQLEYAYAWTDKKGQKLSRGAELIKMLPNGINVVVAPERTLEWMYTRRLISAVCEINVVRKNSRVVYREHGDPRTKLKPRKCHLCHGYVRADEDTESILSAMLNPNECVPDPKKTYWGEPTFTGDWANYAEWRKHARVCDNCVGEGTALYGNKPVFKPFERGMKFCKGQMVGRAESAELAGL